MDTERLIRVMGTLTDENLDMRNWGRSPQPVQMSCGTTMCLAGHTVVEAGYKLRWDEVTHFGSGQVSYGASVTTDGKEIEYLARDLLGLEQRQAAAIFYATDITTVDELWEKVTEVTGVERPQPSNEEAA